MKTFRALLLSLTALQSGAAHDIITTKLTFTRDVSRIFMRRCLGCHGTASSIPLATYEQARPWAVSIKEQVLLRKMPPWGAVKGFGHLWPDNGLTQEEILLVAAWVVGGAPKGDPVYLPKPESQRPAQEHGLKQILVVRSKARIEAAIKIAGIRPLGKSPVESVRIVANYPDGRVEPLLWLFHYDPAWQEIFHFRDSITLPAGSTIESGSPLEFGLMTRASSR